MFPVVVCQRSSSGRSGRKLSIDSDGTIDMFLPVENLEENSLQVENRGDARFIASVCASMKTRKTLELNKKTWRRNRKEKEKRSSISSEGTIVEDLVLSGAHQQRKIPRVDTWCSPSISKSPSAPLHQQPAKPASSAAMSSACNLSATKIGRSSSSPWLREHNRWSYYIIVKFLLIR